MPTGLANQFEREIAAIEKNCMYDLPLLCTSFDMDINDDEGDSVEIYTAFFGLGGDFFDDRIK